MVLLRFFLLNIIIFLGTLTARSQNTGSNSNDIRIHFDKSVYFTGERIWMAVYSGEKEAAPLVDLQVISPDLKIIEHQILALQNGTSATNFLLPDSLEDGYYFIKISDYNNQKINKLYALPIISESMRKDSAIVMELPESFRENNDFLPDRVNVMWKMDSVFQQRSKADFKFQIVDKFSRPLKCTVSMALTDHTGINQSFGGIPTATWSEAEADIRDENDGKLVYKAQWRPGSAPPSSFSFLAFHDVAADRLYPVQPDSGGFKVILDKFTGSRHFQLINWNPFENFYPEFEPCGIGSRLSAFLKGKPRTLPFPSAYYQRFVKRNFLDSLYGVKKMMASGTVPVVDKVEKAADKTYQLKDYEYVREFTSFFRDAVTSTSLIRQDSFFTLRLYSRTRANELTNKPLYQVDGYYMGDENIFLNYIQPADSMELKLYTEPKTIKQYFMPNLTGNGVVCLSHSNIREIIARKQVQFITVNGITPNSSFLQPQKQENVPFLDSQVYWSSGKTTDETGEISFSCELPDALATLTLTICGVTDDGTPFRISKDILVQPK